jgi:hypothetical protein
MVVLLIAEFLSKKVNKETMVFRPKKRGSAMLCLGKDSFSSGIRMTNADYNQ